MKKNKIFLLLTLIMLLICAVHSTAQITGDVNNDNSTDIIDALITAQYCVGLNPSPFNESAADVNNDKDITIVDALLIAQYCVGIIDVFPASTVIYPLAEQYKVIHVPIIDLSLFESKLRRKK